VHRAPEPGPIRGDRGELSVLFQRALAVPPWDGGCGFRNPHRSGRGLQIPRRAASGWFKWTPMPRSMRVGSWSGDSSIKALAWVC
jgi:hypothetical protein